MNALLRCESVSVKYDTSYAVRGVSFDVEVGDYLFVVGENGSGKTSLLKVIAGLVKPTEGSVTFAPDLGRDAIGYLPQQTVIQRDFPASVYEVVISGLTGKLGGRPFFNRQDKQAAENAMRVIGVSELREKPYRTLSGGQQQRVLLARAFCAGGRLLLLDEPVTGLDPLVTIELYECLKTLHAQGMTIIAVSHDVPNAVRYGNKILMLKTDPRFFGTISEWNAAGGFTND